MTDVRGHRGQHRAAGRGPAAVGDRRGLRIALLSLATMIVLLGVAAAGLYGYTAMTAG